MKFLMEHKYYDDLYKSEMYIYVCRYFVYFEGASYMDLIVNYEWEMNASDNLSPIEAVREYVESRGLNYTEIKKRGVTGHHRFEFQVGELRPETAAEFKQRFAQFIVDAKDLDAWLTSE